MDSKAEHRKRRIGLLWPFGSLPSGNLERSSLLIYRQARLGLMGTGLCLTHVGESSCLWSPWVNADRTRMSPLPLLPISLLVSGHRDLARPSRPFSLGACKWRKADLGNPTRGDGHPVCGVCIQVSLPPPDVFFFFSSLHLFDYIL